MGRREGPRVDPRDVARQIGKDIANLRRLAESKGLTLAYLLALAEAEAEAEAEAVDRERDILPASIPHPRDC